MKDIIIYEPAMCCETGLCGVSVDPELLRISTVINTLKENGVAIKRYNLSNYPNEFVYNKMILNFLKEHGVDNLPITVVGNEIKVSGCYPTNAQFAEWLGVDETILNDKVDTDEKWNRRRECNE